MKPGDRVVVEGTVKLHAGDHIVEAPVTDVQGTGVPGTSTPAATPGR